MMSPVFARRAGIVVGAGTVLSAFGVAAPAIATTDCSGVTPIDATELALRNAIQNGDPLICINAGTIDFGSSGVDSDASYVAVDYDVTIVGLGNVVFDGTGDGPGALLAENESDVDLQVENITFQNFWTDYETIPGVVGSTTSGSVTVLDSTFQGNTGYAMVGENDLYLAPEDGDYADITVSNSAFVNNSSDYAPVHGYADISITDSTFVNNDSYSTAVAYQDYDSDAPGATLDMSGNYAADNTSTSLNMVSVYTASAFITNNTFVNNEYYYAGIEYLDGSNGVVAFNTFINNSSGAGNPNLRVAVDSEVGLIGNIFQLDSSDGAVDEDGGALVDEGGNFSTADDSDYLDHAGSHNSVTAAELALSDAADNGGTTWTAALGAHSIAIDAVPAADAENALEYQLDGDQRGTARTGLLDAGAFEYGDADLASTGVDATGIALTGGLIGAAGVALVARRRRRRNA